MVVPQSAKVFATCSDFSALGYHECTARRKVSGFFDYLTVGGRSGLAQANQDLSDYPGPAGLMAGAAAAAGLAMEIFMERNQIPPVGIVVEKFVVTEYCPPAFRIPEEDAR